MRSDGKKTAPIVIMRNAIACLVAIYVFTSYVCLTEHIRGEKAAATGPLMGSSSKDAQRLSHRTRLGGAPIAIGRDGGKPVRQQQKSHRTVQQQTQEQIGGHQGKGPREQLKGSNLQRTSQRGGGDRKLDRHSESTNKREWQPSLPRVLAFYFPQFHADPLNDRLWGAGFTDWDSLRSAPELNRLGGRIPRPTELGYYDLSDPTSDVARRQGELAREHGLDGFAYHHYWFYDESHPGPNLHAPLELLLKTGEPNVPFCLHWAAMKWISTWVLVTCSASFTN